MVARQGGDEFLILIADVDVEDQRTLDIGEVARKVAEEVREAVSRPMVLSETEIYTSASLGISLWPIDASDATTLLKHADIAMYKAKESGRDQYQLFTSTGRDPRAQLSMAGRLRGAVDRDELMLHYQPIVALQSGEIVGAEALLRWQDGDARRGHARRVHSAGRAHRPDRRPLRLGDRGGLPPGRAPGASGASTSTSRSTCRRSSGSRPRCARCWRRSSRSASRPSG